MRDRGLLILSSLLAAGALGGCAPLRLEVPSELAEHRLEVKRAGRQLSFGEFVVQASPPRSRIEKSSWGYILQDEKVWSKHLFGFGLVEGGLLVDEVACERDSVEAKYDVGVGEHIASRHALKCVLSTPDGRYRGTLTMNAKQSVHHLAGELVRSAVAIDLVPSEHPAWTDSRTGDAFAPAGYEIRVGGVQVGAVQIQDGQAVWIDGRAPAWLRKYVALAAGVLFLHNDIHESVDDIAVVGGR